MCHSPVSELAHRVLRGMLRGLLCGAVTLFSPCAAAVELVPSGRLHTTGSIGQSLEHSIRIAAWGACLRSRRDDWRVPHRGRSTATPRAARRGRRVALWRARSLCCGSKTGNA